MQDVSYKFFTRQKLIKLARQTVLLNVIATVVAIGMTASFSNLQTALSFRSVVSSFVYATCIGTLVGLTIVVVVSTNIGKSNFTRLLKLTVTIFLTTLAGIILSNAVFAVFGWGAWAKVVALGAGQTWFALTIAFVFGFSAYFYELSQSHLAITRERLRQKELDAAQAEMLASEAQLASLESRLHPHFLFNTLNSIAALIKEDADLAEKTVEKLARLLRYSLDANAKQLVTLAQELKITRDYLDIEAVRFGSRLDFEIDISHEFNRAKVPPFALQTLVENSIKHVAAKRPGKIKITIVAAQKSDSLEIEVRDDGEGFSGEHLQSGHGLDNLQRRLAAIFGDKAALEIGGDDDESYGRVKVRVPFAPITEENAIETARISG